ncbi:FAD-dependent monooxygenase [Streptomyces sp. NPDC002911]
MRKPRVLIVGAGISGLALLRALANRGIEAEAAECRSEQQASGVGGGALYLPANAVRALHRLGVGDDVERRAERVVRQRMQTHRGRTLADFDVRSVWGGVGDCLAIRRNDLHSVLRETQPAARISFSREVHSADGDGSVTFSDGSTERYDVTVGADGIRSTVRRSAFGGPAPRFLGQVCWRFLVEGHAAPGVRDWTARLGRDGRTFLTVGLGRGGVYCYADVNSRRPEAPDGDWRNLFADFAGPVPQLLEHGAEAHFSALRESVGTDWARPHAALIGDAAHACSPSMAQGGAMALEDALVLAELLGNEGRDGVQRALTAFQARRAARVRWVLDKNHRRDRTRNLPAFVRDLTVRLAGESLFRAHHAPLHPLP